MNYVITINICPSVGSRSGVWNYFTKISDDVNNKSANCKLCNSNVKTAGNTTNLRCHLQKHHPNVDWNDLNKKPQKENMKRLVNNKLAYKFINCLYI